MDALAMPWANARAAHLLAISRMTPVEVGIDWEEGYKTDRDSPLMYTQKVDTRAFLLPYDTREDDGSVLGRAS